MTRFQGRDNAKHHNHNQHKDKDYALLHIGSALPQCGFVGLDVSYGRITCCQTSSLADVDDDDNIL